MRAGIRRHCFSRPTQGSRSPMEHCVPPRPRVPARRRPMVQSMVWPVVVGTLLSGLASSEPCQEHPKEYGIVQFTSEDCRCCYELDEFIQDNDFVYVLFYSTKGRLNIDINAKFEQLASEWKWSRVHFGRIDTDKDRTMAQKWVEPHMVPTNVMYKFGRPVEVQPKDFEKIRDKYQGRPEGIKWMITKYMGEDSDGSNLHYITPVATSKKLAKFVKGHEIAFVGFFKREGDLQSNVYSEAIWKLHQDIDRDDIGAGISMTVSSTVHKKEKAQVPSVAVYLDGAIVEEEGVFAPERWTVSGVVEFLRQFLPLSEQDAGVDQGAQAGAHKEL